MTEISTLGDDLKIKLGAQRQLRQQLADAQAVAEAKRLESGRLEEVTALLSALQETWKKNFEQAVGQLVSQGLAGVFGEDLALTVEMGTERDLPVARFGIRDGRGLTTDVMDARGGGVVNVASFLLRVLLLLSARPALARLLVLDESMNNVSANHIPAVCALMRRVCDEGAFQIVLVTHRAEFVEAADVVYEFSQRDGATVVKRLRSAAEEIAESGKGGFD